MHLLRSRGPIYYLYVNHARLAIPGCIRKYHRHLQGHRQLLGPGRSVTPAATSRPALRRFSAGIARRRLSGRLGCSTPSRDCWRWRPESASRRRLPLPGWNALRGNRDHIVAMIEAEYFLRLVRGRTITVHRVVADEIGHPLHAAWIHVDEQRRVGRHGNQVGVALHADHKGGIAESGAQCGSRIADPRCPLADKHLLAPHAAPRVVIVGVKRHLLFRAAIVVLVNDVRRAGSDRCRRDYLDLWIFCLDGVKELGESAFIAADLLVGAVFIADFDIFQLEWCWMAIPCAAGAPC